MAKFEWGAPISRAITPARVSSCHDAARDGEIVLKRQVVLRGNEVMSELPACSWELQNLLVRLHDV